MSKARLVALILLAVACAPGKARAQEAVAAGELVHPVEITPSKSTVLQVLYVSTAVTQGLDVHSTIVALRHGGVEANPVVSPIASNTVAFIAVKSAAAAVTIFATHKLSHRHKAAAIGILVIANSAYALVASHNYRIAANR